MGYSRKDAGRISRFVRAMESIPTTEGQPAWNRRQVDRSIDAVITYAPQGLNQYSWAALEYASDGSTSLSTDLKGNWNDQSGFAQEITGAINTVIVGDRVTLYPNPNVGNFAFYYQPDGREVQAVSATTAATSSGQQITVGVAIGIAPVAGQKCTIRYEYGFPGQWLWEFVKCTPQAPPCCAHGSATSITATLVGQNYVSPFYTDVNVTYDGTYSLQHGSYYYPSDCDQAYLNTTGNCEWFWKGPIGTFTNAYWIVGDGGSLTPAYETLTATMLLKVGNAPNGDGSTWPAAVWPITMWVWSCGHLNDMINGFRIGTLRSNQPIEYSLGIAFAYPAQTGIDNLNCKSFPDAMTTGGGITISAS